MVRGHVDVDAAPDEAFGLAEDLAPFPGSWHAHAKHQLLYASQGTLALTVAERRWMLPPQRAAWIRAGTKHTVSSATGISLCTVYLAPSLAPDVELECRVFAVTPLAREMLLFAMRWGPSRTVDVARDVTRHAFFAALAGLSREWMAAERPYHMPVAQTPGLARAMRWIDTHLADATVERAAGAAHLSVRTLSRRFDTEAQTSFRDYLQAARMMRAMELLSNPAASVTQSAYEVGFKSLGAFTTAFRERCGETPTEFRARVTSHGRVSPGVLA